MADPAATITLSRDCQAIEIPAGTTRALPGGTSVRIMQQLGGSYTVMTDYGFLYRIESADADALGFARAAQTAANAGAAPAGASAPESPKAFQEQMVWDQLKTIYDPEIPVNIVDLGLVYSCLISRLDSGERRIDVKMSVTAPGCGMANVLKADVERKLGGLPEVKEVNVEVVFDPPWNPSLMSDAAKLHLGLDGY